MKGWKVVWKTRWTTKVRAPTGNITEVKFVGVVATHKQYMPKAHIELAQISASRVKGKVVGYHLLPPLVYRDTQRGSVKYAKDFINDIKKKTKASIVSVAPKNRSNQLTKDPLIKWAWFGKKEWKKR